MTDKIDISAEAVERLAKDHDEVADRHDELIMGHPHHRKTATTLRALAARLAEVEAMLTEARVGVIENHMLHTYAEKRAEAAEAKLAKALEALTQIERAYYQEATITAYETVQHGAETYVRADLAHDSTRGPDWEGFGRDLMEHWPVRDVDGSELFEAALRNGLIVEIPGGYDPEQHFDAEGICPEAGDPWYDYAFHPVRADPAPGPLADPRVKALVEALRYMVRHAGQLEEGEGVYWEATEKARAALAELKRTGR